MLLFYMYIYVMHLFSPEQTGRVYIYAFIQLFQEPVMFMYSGASSQLTPSQLPDSYIYFPCSDLLGVS